MKILFKKLILFSIVFLTACSSPMNKSYERDQSEKDLEFIKNSSVIDNHDYGLLCLYIGFYEDKCHGKTYAEILLNAKEHEEEFISLKKRIESKKLLITKGNIYCQYVYNLSSKLIKEKLDVSFQFYSDTLIGMTYKYDTSFFYTRVNGESTNEEYSVIAVKKNKDLSIERYEIVAREHLVSIKNLSTNKIYYYVSKKATDSFESIFTQEGVIIENHKK